MTSGSRMSSWKERDNNKRRERRRRAIAAKIFAGLRMYGNYKLPKHCDNNEVLKALCHEAGWIVGEDGTTYRKGCKPIGSAVVSACTSNQPSPRTSVNPSPVLSAFASPVSNHCNYNGSNTVDPNSLIPWLKNLSSGSRPVPSKFPHHLYIPGGSLSAPVSPPLSSPVRTPRMKDDPTSGSFWPGLHHPFLPYSTTQSPGTQTPPDSGWLSGVQTPQDGPSSLTFNLVSPNPFTFKEPLSNGGSCMWTPGQSGTCSPIVAQGIDRTADVLMSDVSAEFAFGSNDTMGVVKAWEGERIHDECVPDDLELTLGNAGTSGEGIAKKIRVFLKSMLSATIYETGISLLVLILGMSKITNLLAMFLVLLLCMKEDAFRLRIFIIEEPRHRVVTTMHHRIIAQAVVGLRRIKS